MRDSLWSNDNHPAPKKSYTSSNRPPGYRGGYRLSPLSLRDWAAFDERLAITG
ncbi:MAG: hypothetical protein K8E66_08865 [Phycisphaerales bacterium]|nr:hypothetical protein [Phycisphaerales bacterium]